jgi:hypothetical protein
MENWRRENFDSRMLLGRFSIEKACDGDSRELDRP